MILDTHQHFWKASRGDYHWMTPKVPLLARDYLPEDLRPELRKAGVTRTILVQAAQTPGETEFLLNLAEQTDFVAGVIGWFDLEDSRFPNEFERVRRQHPCLLGVRPMLQDLPDDRWILRPAVTENLRYLAAQRIPFEFLTYTRHLDSVAEALRQAPDLHAVIDHLSKPEVKAGTRQPWADLMKHLAGFANLRCKLSGLVTEADHAQWTPSHLAPYVEHVLEMFGEDRVMFGSDWPVCLLAASYAEVVNAFRVVLAPHLGPAGVEKVFCRNGARFYGLTEANERP